MFRGIDQIFIVPWFILAAIAVASGMKWGVRRGVIVFAIGVLVFVAPLVAFTVAYYAGGGH